MIKAKLGHTNPSFRPDMNIEPFVFEDQSIPGNSHLLRPLYASHSG